MSENGSPQNSMNASGNNTPQAPASDGQITKIFISHSHQDKDIAEVIANTIIDWGSPYGAGEVLQRQIYVSSSPRSGTKFGDDIKQDIIRRIGDTELFILIYTSKDRDWTWCTYEFGIHTNPPSVKADHGSRKIISQCLADPVPEALKAGRVVKITKDDIYKFTREYFKTAGFFPGHKAYSANISTKILHGFAETFYNKLRGALPNNEDRRTIPLISKTELMDKNERLTDKGGVLQDPATVVVRRGQPLETDYEFAGRVMYNLDSKVNYRYYFDSNEDLSGVCRLIQTLAVSGIADLRNVNNREAKMEEHSDDIARNLKKIRNYIIIGFLDGKRGARRGPEDFCVLNATNNQLATYYLSYKLDKNDAFVKLYESEKAQDCIEWLSDYTIDISETSYVFHSTKEVDIYEDSPFRKALNARLQNYFPERLRDQAYEVLFKDI